MAEGPSTLMKALGGLMVTVVFFGAIELIGRIIAGPPAAPIVVKMPDGEEGFFIEQGGRLTPRRAEHKRWWPTGPKDPNKTRIMVLGGSSVAAPKGAPRFMVAHLEHALGDEIINLGIGGMDTGHLIGLIPAFEALQPDIVVLYSGHNDLGNAVFERRYSDPTAVRIAKLRQRFGALWTYQLMERALRAEEVRTVDADWDLPDVGLQAEQIDAALADYEARMRRLIRSAQSAGAEVVLSTVVSNAFFPSASWECLDRVKALGVRPTRARVPPVVDVSLEAVTAERAKPPACRDLEYIEARVRWRLDQREGVAETLESLRDRDPLPLRAPRETNRMIRALAAETGATLADAAVEFRARGDGLEPPAWFDDQVHLSNAGHAALAAVLAETIATSRGRPSPTVHWPDPWTHKAPLPWPRGTRR
ncbi:MAG: SGNH/GDSL hydrolase family protein [Myxococcota bacterium]